MILHKWGNRFLMMKRKKNLDYYIIENESQMIVVRTLRMATKRFKETINLNPESTLKKMRQMTFSEFLQTRSNNKQVMVEE